MSDDQIIKTKKESGHEEFERLRAQQETRSERAARVASLSRRPAGSEKQEATRLVRVTAQERSGHSGFWRAGQHWTSDPEGRVALVSERMLAALKAEAMLRVEVDPDGVDRSKVTDKLDVPERAEPTPAVPPQQAVTVNVSGVDAARIEAEVTRRLNEALAAHGVGQPPPPPAAGDDDTLRKGTSKK